MKPRRSLLAVSILCLTLAIPILAANERLQLGAVLTGFRQVPSVSTKGRGEFRAKVNDDGTQIKFTLKYADLEGAPTAAHIHFGQHFSNGGIMAILCGGGKAACTSTGNTLSGTITASDIVGPADQGIEAGSFAEALRAVRTVHGFVDVHTDKFPNGEIRGQIRHRYLEDDDE